MKFGAAVVLVVLIPFFFFFLNWFDLNWLLSSVTTVPSLFIVMHVHTHAHAHVHTSTHTQPQTDVSHGLPLQGYTVWPFHCATPRLHTTLPLNVSTAHTHTQILSLLNQYCFSSVFVCVCHFSCLFFYIMVQTVIYNVFAYMCTGVCCTVTV